MKREYETISAIKEHESSTVELYPGVIEETVNRHLGMEALFLLDEFDD